VEMKRILILLASLLLAGPPAALAEENGQSFDSATKKQYVRDKCVYDDLTCVLAISTDGAYGIAVEGNRETAKYNAVRQCQLAAAQPDSCQIVDVNGESEFIKSRQGDTPSYNGNSVSISAKDYGYNGPLEPIKGAQSLSVRAGYEWNCTKTMRMVLAGQEQEDVNRLHIRSYRQSGKTKLGLGIDGVYVIFDAGSRGTDFVLEGVKETEPDDSVDSVVSTQALDNFIRESGSSKDEWSKTLRGALVPLLNRKVIQDHVFQAIPPKAVAKQILALFGIDSVSQNATKYSYQNKILGVTEEGGTQKVVLGIEFNIKVSNIPIAGDHRFNLTGEGLGYSLVDVASGLNTAWTMKTNVEIESHSIGNHEAVVVETQTCGLINDVQVMAKNQRLNQTATVSSEKIWCATRQMVSHSTRSTCLTNDGKPFDKKSQAQAEHRRLKNKTNTVLTAESDSKPPGDSLDKSLDLEFWQSIKDSNDPDMYREYLRQFPSGAYAGLAKLKIKKLGGDSQVVNASIPNLDYGDYYALVIGNNEYPGLSNLRSAVNDAKVVSTVLEVDYGFNVQLLENASRKDILRSLKHLRETVSAKDNVLIYYAGHGYLDKDTDYGYWLPVDSERDDDSNWIPTDRVVSQIKGMKAKHVMVVADSCFSGTITRAIKIEQRTPEWLSEIVKKKARTALTSGGLEPVMDTGSGNHSAFAYAFISLLEENDGVLDASQLFSKLRPKVMVNSTQTPQYGKIHMAGDDGGDFLFVRQ
jgi:hypothetical protein